MIKSLQILYENERFMIVVKPQNTPVQATRGGSISILDLAEEYLNFECGIEEPHIGLVHRLDQPTGGLMLLSKTPSATKSLSQQFQSRQVKKTYLVLVKGHMQSDSAVLCHYLSADAKSNFVTSRETPAPGYQEARLRYRCLHRTLWLETPVSLLEVHLDTGRQHQIRCQMNAIGHGVIGDRKYGIALNNEPLMLWAYALSFTDLKQAYHFELPPDMEPMLTIWQQIHP
jgi:23S rRNA pseudouridine1911/1915/1917 synthase